MRSAFWELDTGSHYGAVGSSRAILTCAHERGVKLFLIEPGNPIRTLTSNLAMDVSDMNA